VIAAGILQAFAMLGFALLIAAALGLVFGIPLALHSSRTARGAALPDSLRPEPKEDV
jgi:ABC-type methionine transport system permease subunit